MKGGLALVLLLLSLPACSQGVAVEGEIVEGFHGYPWGTHYSEVAELEDSAPVAEREGLAVFTADTHFLGLDAMAAYYFHPGTGRLVEGSYVIGLTREGCQEAWEELVEHVAADFPHLTREDRLPAPDEETRARYDSDCEYFIFNAESEDWSTTFLNPEAPHDRVGLWMGVVGRTVRVTVYYRGGAGQAWLDGPRRRPLIRRVPKVQPPTGTLPQRPPPPPPAPAPEVPFGRA
jgi:hypothetical protein